MPDEIQMPWLTSFLAVVDHSTFTAAARALHRAQPRVSAHIAALENRLNVRVFDRGARGAMLTEAGARFVPHARAAVISVRAGMDSIESLSGTLQGRVAVGSFPGASGVLLAPLIKEFRERHPGVTIDLLEGDPGWLDDAIGDLKLDLAVRVADPPKHRTNLDVRLLRFEKIRLAVPADHPSAESTDFDPRELDGQSLVVTGAPSEGWTDFMDLLGDSEISPHRIINVAHPTTLIALVRAGLGVGLLGEMAATITAFGDVTTKALPWPQWRRGIHVCWNNQRSLSVAANAFLKALNSTANSSACL